MINLLHVKLYELFHDKCFWITLSMSIFLGVFIPIDNDKYIGYESISLSFYNTCLICIMGILFGGIWFGSSFLNRTTNNIVSSGHGRFKIFLVNIIVFFIGLNLIILSGPIIKLLVIGQTVDKNILLITIIVSSLLGAAVSIVPLCFSVMFKDIGRTTGVSIGIYFCSIFLLNSCGNLQSSIFRFLPLAQMRLILYRPVDFFQFKEGFLDGLIILLGLLSVSYLYFRKLELD